MDLADTALSMSGITVRRRVAKFEVGYVERSRIFLWMYPRALASPRMRRLVYGLPLSPLRTAIVGRFFRQLFQSWTDGDLESTLKLVDQNIELNLFGLGDYRGPDGMRRAWEEWHQSFHGTDIEVSEVIDNGTGQVASVVRVLGEGLDTGFSFAQPGVMVWTVNEGLMGTAARVFATRAEALEATGLST